MRFADYFLIEKEFREFLGFIEDSGFLALPQVISKDEYESGKIEAIPPTQFKLPQGQYAFYFIPKDIPLGEVVYNPMKYKPFLCYIMSSESPVMKIEPCLRDGNKLYNGKICYYSESARNKNYSSQFKNTCDSIIDYLKNWVKETLQNIGPETYKLAQKGELEIRQIYGFWLYHLEFLKAFKSKMLKEAKEA